ncbi:MAG TPA: PAS domain S-box protein [Myxococcaceae bacterium]|nr:PAS domain S-box protein [Myxococcaceae bacterium]
MADSSLFSGESPAAEPRLERSGEGQAPAPATGPPGDGLEALRAAFEAIEGLSEDGFLALIPTGPEDDAPPNDFHPVYLNPAAERLLGRTRHELTRKSLLEAFERYRDSELFTVFVRVASSGRGELAELRDPLDDRRFLRVAVTPCLTGISVRLQDVTRQRKVHEELLDREMRYRLLSQATNDVLWDWDLREGRIHWGEAMYNVLGYRREDVRGSLLWWSEHLHPEDRERVAAGLDEAIEGGLDAWSDEYRFRRADGTYAFFFDRGFIARDESGTPYRMLGSMVDLTERVRAEEALLESEERFRAMFTQAAVGMALVSTMGGWLKCNQRLCDILGYPCEALLGRTLREVLHPADAARVMRPVQGVLSGELRGHTTEVRCVRNDGEHVWVTLTISLVREASGAPKWFVAIVEDIQERKRLEEEARRAQEFENQLHGIVGHDIRSPLAAIKATVSSLMLRPELTEPQRKAVVRIARSTERIQRLVQQLLDYTRIRIGDGLPVHPKPTDMQELCRRVAEEFTDTHPYRVVLHSEADGHGEWDPDRLMQLVSNLVENALKYGAAEQPVTLTLRGDEDEVMLEVHNDGEPIPPELLPTLFEPFRRGAQNEQTVKVSLGLGLYVVKEVVRAHGGAVSVRSDREAGTTVSVRLPRHPPVRSASEPSPTLH